MHQIKISFIGDIMCEKPLLKASRVKRDRYDFTGVFQNTRDFFKESDYIVGNLETVFAGARAGYTTELYSFNTPDAFLEAVRTSGIHLVTTANNHCLDRGREGLLRTLELLDEKGIAHVGACRSKKENCSIYVKEFGDTKVAVLNSTYGTNTSTNGVALTEEEQHMVRLMRPQRDILNQPPAHRSNLLREAAIFLPKKILSKETKMYIKRRLKLEYNYPRTDNDWNTQAVLPYLERIRDDIKKARELADLVIYCPHMGGQFNERPGRYSEYMMDFLKECGVDMVAGTHPHIVQKMEVKKMGDRKVLCAYSLGNYSISPGSVYVLPDYLPEYSIMLHVYVDRKAINRVTFSVLKIVEDSKKRLTVYPVHQLYPKLDRVGKELLQKDVSFVCSRFLGRRIHAEILPEYETGESIND